MWVTGKSSSTLWTISRTCGTSVVGSPVVQGEMHLANIGCFLLPGCVEQALEPLALTAVLRVGDQPTISTLRLSSLIVTRLNTTLICAPFVLVEVTERPILVSAFRFFSELIELL